MKYIDKIGVYTGYLARNFNIQKQEMKKQLNKLLINL
jgi:hypothetical protein